jgi:hypothetical protein
MNKIETTPVSTGEDAERAGYKEPPSPQRYQSNVMGANERVAELEVENSRLHRLVAELLIKNQQLRKAD